MISLTIFNAVRHASAEPIRAATAIRAGSHGHGANFELLSPSDRRDEAVRRIDRS